MSKFFELCFVAVKIRNFSAILSFIRAGHAQIFCRRENFQQICTYTGGSCSKSFFEIFCLRSFADEFYSILKFHDFQQFWHLNGRFMPKNFVVVKIVDFQLFLHLCGRFMPKIF